MAPRMVLGGAEARCAPVVHLHHRRRVVVDRVRSPRSGAVGDRVGSGCADVFCRNPRAQRSRRATVDRTAAVHARRLEESQGRCGDPRVLRRTAPPPRCAGCEDGRPPPPARVEPGERLAGHLYLRAPRAASRRERPCRAGDGLIPDSGDVLAKRPFAPVAPRLKRSRSRRAGQPSPSILGSQTYSGVAPGSARLTRASNSARSAAVMALSRESMATRCSTGAKASARCPPGRRVGLSGVTSSGWASSSATSSRQRRS